MLVTLARAARRQGAQVSLVRVPRPMRTQTRGERRGGRAARGYRAHVTTIRIARTVIVTRSLCMATNVCLAALRRGRPPGGRYVRKRSGSTTEPRWAEHAPTRRCGRRVVLTKRRIGGRRSPSIVRRRRGKGLAGIGQGSASCRGGTSSRQARNDPPTTVGASRRVVCANEVVGPRSQWTL